MANSILSQDEIDALLNDAGSGNLDSQEESEDKNNASKPNTVAKYSFKHPSMITKDQLRKIGDLHDDFTMGLQSRLSISLKTNVEINRVSVEQQMYNEFIVSLSDITHIVLFELEPFSGLAFLEINLSLVFGIVDLYLGGEGDVESSLRKITEVEDAILEPITEYIFTALKHAFDVFVPVTIKPGRTESTPEYVQAAPADAPVLVFTFDVKVGLSNGTINLCYPLPMVQSLLRSLRGKTGQLDNYYGKIEAVDSKRNIMASLMNVPLQASIDFGDAWISGRDWLNITKGDIIMLEQKIGSNLKVKIEDHHFYNGIPGRVKSNLAVKIRNRIDMKAEDPRIEALSS